MDAPRRRSALAALAFVAACHPAGGPDPVPTDASLALRGADVVDVAAGTVVEDRTVLVSGDRIVHVGGPDTRIPDGARTVDARGGFLLPGLWDMHVHVTWDRSTLPLYLAHGVTGVRDMGGAPDSVMEVREEVRGGAVDGPWIVAAGPLVDGPKEGVPWRLEARTRAQGRAAVDSVRALRADFVKVHNGIAPEAFRGVVARADEVGLPVVGHAPPSVGLRAAVEAGQDGVEHTTALMEAALPPASAASLDSLEAALERFLARGDTGVLALMAARDVPFTPTLVAGRAAARRLDPAVDPAPEEAWVRDELRAFWEFIPVPPEVPPAVLEARYGVAELGGPIVRAMRRAGVPLLAGTDVGLPGLVPGRSLHDELERLVAAGLPEAEALRAATLAPARFLGAADTLGTVEAGKRADLVLLEADPLEDISAVRRLRAVVVRGQLLAGEDLAALTPP